jgi:hypothetical protein
MPIPSNITREHVIKAIRRIKQDGIPARQAAKKWHTVFEGKRYPPKLLVSWANFYPNRVELDTNPNNFNTDMAVDYLAKLGFESIKIGK